jgi:hypothetical protein
LRKKGVKKMNNLKVSRKKKQTGVVGTGHGNREETTGQKNEKRKKNRRYALCKTNQKQKSVPVLYLEQRYRESAVSPYSS